MPSFDIVSAVDMQEVDNAINQAKKEIANRYDFRGSQAAIEWDKKVIIIKGEDDYKLDTIKDILQTKMHRRGVDIKALDFSDKQAIGGLLFRRDVTLKQGIDRDMAKKINKSIKESKLKVQSQIQDDKLKVTSKSIDELQECISQMKGQDFGIPLQFENMRN